MFFLKSQKASTVVSVTCVFPFWSGFRFSCESHITPKFSGQRLSTLMDGLLGELHLWGKTTTSSSEVLPKTPAKKRFQGKEVDGSMCVFTIDISSNVCWCFPHNIDVGSKKSLPLKRMGFFSAWKRFSKGPEKLTYRTWNTAVSKMSFAFFFWNASLCVLS